MSKIHSTIYGKGYPLVLFHGWGFDSQIWSPLLPTLTQSYKLYLIDLPGFGLTPVMGWQEFKSELLNILPKEFSMLGWSMGGLLATRLAMEEPQSVSHLLNVTSSPYFLREKDWPGVDRNVFQTFYQSLISNPEKTLEEFISLQLQGQKVVLGETPSLVGLQNGIDLLMNWDLRQDLNRITNPVCYIFGRLDAIVPHQVMLTIQQRYPHIKCIMFPEAAHAPFLSHPTEFIMTLEKFLK